MLDIPWMFDRQSEPSPHLQRHHRICLPNIKLSRSQGAADSKIQGAAVVMIRSVWHGPRWFLLALSLKKISSAHRGYEHNIPLRISVGNFSFGLHCPQLHLQTKIPNYNKAYFLELIQFFNSRSLLSFSYQLVICAI